MSQEYLVSRIKSGNDLYHYAKSVGLTIGASSAINFFHKGLVHLVGIQNLRGWTVQDWADVHEWCRNTIGKDNYSWAGIVFAFRNPEDAIMFKLAWG